MSIDTASPACACADTSLAAVAVDLARTPTLWRHAVRFRADRREHTRILVGDGFEAWLLMWRSGQSTDVHDHGGGSAGAITVIQGRLHETVPDPRGVVEPVEHTLGTGAVRTFDAAHVHAVANRDPEPAISLHVTPPGCAA